MAGKTDIYVYADWEGMPEPVLFGVLSAQQAKGKKAFGFSYESSWLQSGFPFLLDPDIALFTGVQYPAGKENFGVFLDSMPDTWGRMLMKRRAAQQAKERGHTAKALYDTDFLLGVHDESRMGALRFKIQLNGPFLDNDAASPAPPWATIRELQYSAEIIESGKDTAAVNKWLSMLMAPGSSLGGARPKANVIDEDGNLWIAKFPSKNDTTDKAAWEYVAYRLATNAGIVMPECRLQHIAGPYHTFFTKRFDRTKQQRIHFSSAMAMTGKNEYLVRDDMPGYLDIADFIQSSGANVEADLKQLWRRIIFSICISNTDDHLRNHGFLLAKNGWCLSPAYDINPSVDKNGLSLTIDMDDNSLDVSVAKSTGIYYRLYEKEMNAIIDEVKTAVSGWQRLASESGISRGEQLLMEHAFRL